jgi:hypothetical protein
MTPNPGPPRRRTRRFPLPMLIAVAGLAVLIVGMGLWAVFSSNILNKLQQPTATIPAATASAGTPAGSVSPLVFGTNLSLFSSNDHVLQSTTARSQLQQLHLQIIRMPMRSTLSDDVEKQAAQIIKDAGAIPLVILHGPADQNVLADNTHSINIINQVFGNSVVYYEYGNEQDLQGVSADNYVSSWNTVVPQLKQVAPNGRFVGPVNFQYSHNYLHTFLQQAQPRPDAVSWHEYSCDDSWSGDRCIANIDEWTTHISDARAVMTSTVGTTLPIMITEWNYAPNALPNDGKADNSQFLQSWTQKALQVLAANRVFASMQYACTNFTASLISNEDQITPMGLTFQAQYQQMITENQQPAPITTGVANQPQSTPANQAGSGAQNGKEVFSFEDGGTDNWQGHGDGVMNVQNSSSVALDGNHSLHVSLQGLTKNDYPYVSVDVSHMQNPPGAGQTVTANVYLASNAVSLAGKVFVVDQNNAWLTNNFVSLTPGTWTRLSFTIAPGHNTPIGEIGLQFHDPQGSGIPTDVYIDSVGWG